MPLEVRTLLKLINREESLVWNIVEEHMSQRNCDSDTVTGIFLDMNLSAEVNDKLNFVIKKRLMRSLSGIVFAGVETANGTLDWLILYMIAYPDIQKRVQIEIDEEIGRSRRVETA